MLGLAIMLAVVSTGGYFAASALAPSLNRLEVLGLSFGLGIGLDAFAVFLLAWAGASISYVTALSAGLGILAAAALLWWKAGSRRRADAPSDEHRLDLLALAGAVLIGVLLLATAVRAVATGLSGWDEFSFWGLAAKRMLLENSVLLKGKVLSKFESYPLLVPTAGALLASPFRGFAENFARLLPPLMLASMTVFLGGFLRRLRLNSREIVLFLLLALFSGRVLVVEASRLYADMTFAFYYSTGVLVFLSLWFAQRDGTSEGAGLVLSGLLFSLACWTKPDGLPLAVVTIPVLFLFAGRPAVPLVPGWRRPAILASATALMPACNALFCRVNGLSGQRYPSYFTFAVTHLPRILRAMAGKTGSPALWSGFWALVVAGFLVAVVRFRHNRFVLLLCALIAANFALLLAAFAAVMQPGELLIAASFERYVIHFLPIALVMLAALYSDARDQYVGVGAEMDGLT